MHPELDERTLDIVHDCFYNIGGVKPWSQGWLIAARAYPGFCSMKRLEVFLLPLDGMLALDVLACFSGA